MPVRIRSLTGQTITIEAADLSWSVGQLKQGIEDQENIPAELQRVIFGGQELDDAKVLKESGINELTIMHIVVRSGRPLTDEEVAHQLQEEEMRLQPHMAIADIRFLQQHPQLYRMSSGSGPIDELLVQAPKVMLVLHLATIVQSLSILDSIWTFVLVFNLPSFAGCLLLFPFVGFYAAQQHSWRILVFYLLSIIANTTARILINIISPSQNIEPVVMVMNTFVIMFNFLNMFAVYRTIRSIRSLTEEETQLLENRHAAADEAVV